MNSSSEILVASPVSDDAILTNCLARSPDLADGYTQLIELRNLKKCGEAFNHVLQETKADAVVFAHQDVYLPRGFIERLKHRIAEVQRVDPTWAVLGVLGITPDGALAGKVWSTAWGKVFEGSVDLPMPVVTADELLIVVRGDKALFFDESLPNFHLFATDIVQTALLEGRKSYAIDAPVVHHDKPVIALDASYREAYKFMRHKWAAQLPIPNLIVPISHNILHLYMQDLRIRAYRGWAAERIIPQDNPALLAQKLGWEQSSWHPVKQL